MLTIYGTLLFILSLASIDKNNLILLEAISSQTL